MPESASVHREAATTDGDKPFLVSHFFHVLRNYFPVIVLGVIAVGIGYVLFAALTYLLSPAEKVTKLQFRLDFQGSTEGKYPNGLRFSPADIVSPPVLRKVYDDNKLGRFVPFEVFSRSFVVLESNRAYELLALEYQARLSDPKLSPVDRERIEKEFESKRASIAKNDYALVYSVADPRHQLPRTLTLKVLTSVLQGWAEYAKREKHVLQYRVGVLSPAMFRETALGQNDYVVAIQILRSNLHRLSANIVELREIPSADLARTKDGFSLDDVQARLEDLIRFDLEPLVPLIRANNLIKNPEMTTRFIEAQLAYDQRMLQAKQEVVGSVRQALAAYDPSAANAASEARTPSAADSSSKPASGSVETLMPQISETFLDRLVALSKQAADTQYRQRAIDKLMQASEDVVPWQQAVRYDEDLLQQLHNGAGGGGSITPAEVERRIRQSEEQARNLLAKINEIYLVISANLDPGTEIYTVTSVPASRTERQASLPRLAMWGFVVVLASFPLIVAACLIHNRVREEEREEAGFV